MKTRRDNDDAWLIALITLMVLALSFELFDLLSTFAALPHN